MASAASSPPSDSDEADDATAPPAGVERAIVGEIAALLEEYVASAIAACNDTKAEESAASLPTDLVGAAAAPERSAADAEECASSGGAPPRPAPSFVLGAAPRYPAGRSADWLWDRLTDMFFMRDADAAAEGTATRVAERQRAPGAPAGEGTSSPAARGEEVDSTRKGEDSSRGDDSAEGACLQVLLASHRTTCVHHGAHLLLSTHHGAHLLATRTHRARGSCVYAQRTVMCMCMRAYVHTHAFARAARACPEGAEGARRVLACSVLSTRAVCVRVCLCQGCDGDAGTVPAPVKWSAFDGSYEYSDCLILYFKDMMSETYLKQSIVPILQASHYKPVPPPGGVMQPMWLLPWRAAGSNREDATFLILVPALGARAASNGHQSVGDGVTSLACLLKCSLCMLAQVRASLGAKVPSRTPPSTQRRWLS